MIDLRRFPMPSACFGTKSSSTLAQICLILRLSAGIDLGLLLSSWVSCIPILVQWDSNLASWRATLRLVRIRCDLGRFVRAIHSSPLLCGDAPSCTNVQFRLSEPKIFLKSGFALFRRARYLGPVRSSL